MKIEKRKMLEEMIDRLTYAKKTLLKEFKNGYLGKRIYEVEYKDGSKNLVEQLTKNNRNGDAVVIIPITNEFKYVMIVESRPNTESAISISFPAGMVDENESFLEAAKRELLEETGYSFSNIEELEWHYQDQGCSSAKITTFLAKGCKKIKNSQLDDFEKLECIELEEGDIIELINENRINEANTKLALYTYDLKRKRLIK